MDDVDTSHKQHTLRVFVISMGRRGKASAARKLSKDCGHGAACWEQHTQHAFSSNTSEERQQKHDAGAASRDADWSRGDERARGPEPDSCHSAIVSVITSFDLQWPPPTSSVDSSAPDNPACRSKIGKMQGSQTSACAGNESGYWLIRPEFLAPHALGLGPGAAAAAHISSETRAGPADGARPGCLSWAPPVDNGLPIVAEYSDCAENAEVLWRLVVYGHWLVWGLPRSRHAQALEGVELFNCSVEIPPSSCSGQGCSHPRTHWRFEPGLLQREIRAGAARTEVHEEEGKAGSGQDHAALGWVPGEPDMFAWRARGCRFLPLEEAAEAFGAAQRAAVEGGGCSLDKHGEKTFVYSGKCDLVKRILVAGTSRARGMAYAM